MPGVVATQRRAGGNAGVLGLQAAKVEEAAVEFVDLKVAEQPWSAGVSSVTRTECRMLVDLEADPDHVARLVLNPASGVPTGTTGPEFAVGVAPTAGREAYRYCHGLSN